MEEGGGRGRDKSVQSVHRAISILQVIARRGTAGVTEISQELAIHKSTTSRLIGTLEARGLVEQTSHRGSYRLSYGIVQLAEGIARKHDLTVTSRMVCTALADAVGDTVNVAVHEGRSVVTIDQVIGSSQVTSVNWVGRHQSLHATSAGKVFLAHLPPAELQTYLDDEMERLTEFTVVDPAELEKELALVRQRGYAQTVDEQEIGLAAVAAPVRALDGRVIATLIVSGPTFRITDATIPEIARQVMTSAAEISERNGYPKSG
ncbi:IclR family transcriptional regulator [Nocardioides hungaricus]